MVEARAIDGFDGFDWFLVCCEPGLGSLAVVYFVEDVQMLDDV